MLPMRLCEGDLGFITKKLDIFENKMDVIGTAVAAMVGESSCTLSPDWPALRSTQPLNTVRNKPVYQSTTVGISAVTSERHGEIPTMEASAQDGDQLILPYGTEWAAVTSTPSAVHLRSDDNRGVGRSASVADSEYHPSDSDQPFTEVTARKRRRLATRKEQPQLVNNQATNSQQRQSQRGPLLVGNSTLCRAQHVTAATSLERSLFCIDNVSRATTVHDIRNLVSRMGVRVLSCFECKPRHRRDEAVPTNRKAFRLCIDKDDRHLLLDPAKWPMHITVSNWFFKSARSSVQAPVASRSVSENDEQHRDLHTSQQQRAVDQISQPAASRSASGPTEAMNQCLSSDDADSHVEENDVVEDMEATILTSVDPSDQNSAYPISGSEMLASSSDVTPTSPAAAAASDGRHR